MEIVSPVQERAARKASDDHDGTWNWDTVRRQFELSTDYIHLGASQFIASHPKPVREAIVRYRDKLDSDPVSYVLDHENQYSQSVRIAAARYLGVDDPGRIALTDSTTMGLGLVYHGFKLGPGDEVIATQHDHYSHLEAIRLAAERAGGKRRFVELYKDLSRLTEELIVESVTGAITERTKILALTWVHSSTGLKLPIAKICRAVKAMNRERDEERRIWVVVDGVHGFGIETEEFGELGCDVFVAGCHKWLYGPRGTGLIAATEEAWQMMRPTIPSFTYVMDAMTFGLPRPEKMDGLQMTPGGFHSLEHRWALKDAFDWVESIGKLRIRSRVAELHRQAKEGLREINGVTVHTPMQGELSSGIVAFEVQGYTTEQTVNRLKEKKIIATSSPYQVSYARFTPGIYNTPEEVELGLKAVRELAR
ncbi:aminotransferase class V-fold PLP-dependent enzyme [Paenibacillus chartarius]|uniref:Aminotransferase class V-fold PLP-dependent enzyme n=1 Tax=Paenibacillus chartarius TaxID=747481 RepID=A0ABV6DUU1_9BACL